MQNIIFLVNSPLEHFEIKPITFNSLVCRFLALDFSLTVVSFFFLFLFLFFLFVYVFVIKRSALVGSYLQGAIISYYDLLYNYVSGQLISVRAQRFFPFFFAVFNFILLLNFLSLVVYNTSITGHLIVTFFIGLTFFLGFIIIALLNFGIEFKEFFVPKGLPVFMVVFLTAIEIFSFLIRPFSLSVRLFANMLAGHTLLNIFAKFYVFVAGTSFLVIALPIFLIACVFLLEIGVAIIQAYIFLTLLCIYFNDIFQITH